MIDARRITVGPIAAAYLEIQQGTVLVPGTDYEALHAEAEALRVALLGIASVNPSERGIEWAKSYASDGLKGSGSELYARWLDTFKEAEALRADSQHWKKMHAGSMAMHMSVEFERDELRTELEEARGLLREAREAYAEAIHWEDQQPVMKKIDAFLTATTSPDVQAEQGERQEAVVYAVHAKGAQVDHHCPLVSPDMAADYLPGCATPLYTTPQPGPDVRALVEALERASKTLAELNDLPSMRADIDTALATYHQDT